MSYPARGLTLLVTEHVLAIPISGDSAPRIPLVPVGIGGKPAGALRIGITLLDLKELLGGEEASTITPSNPDTEYQYFSSIGLAVRAENGVVVEIVVWVAGEP